MSRCEHWHDPLTGLRAVLVIDDERLGPAAGGVRTGRYASAHAAEEEARGLARAMTIKCAIAGLDAGGGKIVVFDVGADRAAAFEELGRRVHELDGALLTAGDLGTRATDLEAMARATEHVHTGGARLSAAAGRALLRCVQACVDVHSELDDGREAEVSGLAVAVQGCGMIGGAAARALSDAGAVLTVADLDSARARSLAAEVGGQVGDPALVLTAATDVVSPCAAGQAITEEIADQLSAWAVCGAANNVMANEAAERILWRRKVLFVPDVIASAGAVIEGVGERVMKLEDRTPLLDRLRVTAREVLQEVVREATTTGVLASAVVQARTLARLGAATLGAATLALLAVTGVQPCLHAII